MRVVVICEDFTKDQYIAKPVIEAMLDWLGRPRARVVVAREPRLRGVEDATNWDRLRQVIARYEGMADAYVLLIDRDADPGRRKRLHKIEALAKAALPEGVAFYAENAWQELEVWALAAVTLPASWSWKGIRKERDPKERYFDPIVAKRGLQDEPGEGRQTLGREAGRQYQRVRQLCPEDVQALEASLGRHLRS